MYASAGRSFLRKLAAALPTNFAVFWLVMGGSMPAVFILSAISAPIGALLLMAMERQALTDGAQAASAGKIRRRATVHEFPRQPRPA